MLKTETRTLLTTHFCAISIFVCTSIIQVRTNAMTAMKRRISEAGETLRMKIGPFLFLRDKNKTCLNEPKFKHLMQAHHTNYVHENSSKTFCVFNKYVLIMRCPMNIRQTTEKKNTGFCVFFKKVVYEKLNDCNTTLQRMSVFKRPLL